MRVSIFLLLFISSPGLFAQARMNSAEVGYVYDLTHEFLIDHQLASNGNQHKVFLKFSLNSGNTKISDYLITYDVRANYMAEKKPNAEIRLDSTNIIYTGFREFVFEFEVEQNENEELIVLDIYNIPKNRKFKYDIPFAPKDVKSPSFMLYDVTMDIPYFSSYLNEGEKVRVKNLFDSTITYSMTGYQYDAPMPMPPFDQSTRAEKVKTRLDSTYQFGHDEVLTIEKRGVYTISANGNESEAIQLLVGDPYYPYFGDYSDISLPLIFLSTKTEYEALNQADNARDGFEDFVQNTISSNEKVAKDFIKFYYRRIRKAGRLFTEDREGWKTDRGMIYLIFGDPLQVFRNEDNEMWVYTSGSGGRLRFVFDKISQGQMVKYQLIRGDRFKEDWMTAVTQWRSGRIIE